MDALAAALAREWERHHNPPAGFTSSVRWMAGVDIPPQLLSTIVGNVGLYITTPAYFEGLKAYKPR